MPPERTFPDYEYLDHTADVGVIGYGADIKETFCNVGRGLFGLIVEPEQVEERESLEISAQGENREELLVEWLNELIYLFDVEHFLFKRFEILELSPKTIRSVGYGERVDTTRHDIKMGVKSATYHLLEVREGRPYRAQVIIDI